LRLIPQANFGFWISDFGLRLAAELLAIALGGQGWQSRWRPVWCGNCTCYLAVVVHLALSSRRACVFAFYSNRLGCIGSIVISIIGTIALVALMWAINT
jgi:hypothetical protein